MMKLQLHERICNYHPNAKNILKINSEWNNVGSQGIKRQNNENFN